MESCRGCGLFLHHTPECSWHNGWRAVYYSYTHRYEQAFDTPREALDYLMSGEDEGVLSSDAIIGPDNYVLMNKDALTDTYVHGRPYVLPTT